MAGDDLPDHLVRKICDVQVTNAINSDFGWAIQFLADRWAPITRVAGDAVTGHGGDRTIGRDHSNHVVARICYVQIGRAVYSNTVRPVELGMSSRASVAGVP